MADPNAASNAAIEGWARGTARQDRKRRPPRPVSDGAYVELREITDRTVRSICRLAVAESQRGFVAPNSVSLAEALFSKQAWYRAVYADGQPVGFAMLSVNERRAEYYLWRFMIAAPFQRRGYGAAAIRLILEHVRTLPKAKALMTSWVPADGGPEPFYRGLGFEPTGEVDDGEVVGRLAL